MKRPSIVLTAPILILALSVCSRAAEAPVSITGSSNKFIVQGQYSPIAMDRVESLSIENGKLVVHGPLANVTLDLPASAQATKPDRHWTLATETDAGGGKRSMVFTHDQSVEDFTIELPAGESDMHYGVLEGPGGPDVNDVMLFAFGDQSRCYWGYVTIAPKPGTR